MGEERRKRRRRSSGQRRRVGQSRSRFESGLGAVEARAVPGNRRANVLKTAGGRSSLWPAADGLGGGRGGEREEEKEGEGDGKGVWGERRNCQTGSRTGRDQVEWQRLAWPISGARPSVKY